MMTTGEMEVVIYILSVNLTLLQYMWCSCNTAVLSKWFPLKMFSAGDIVMFVCFYCDDICSETFAIFGMCIRVNAVLFSLSLRVQLGAEGVASWESVLCRPQHQNHDLGETTATRVRLSQLSFFFSVLIHYLAHIRVRPGKANWNARMTWAFKTSLWFIMWLNLQHAYR